MKVSMICKQRSQQARSVLMIPLLEEEIYVAT